MPPDRTAPPEERIRPIISRLKKTYPDATIALDFTTPLECLVATILSAQSTDVRVNIVTKALFKKYKGPKDYLKVPEEELQKDIQSTGFFRQKTRALRGMSETLLSEFGGEVPKRISELTQLKGVARKTANVVQNACFPEVALKDPDAGIAVDTHVGRISVRLGLTGYDSKDAPRIEGDLLQIIPKKDRPRISHLFIDHGRQICDAKKPQCGVCPVEKLCPSSQISGCPDLYRTTAKPRSPRKEPL